MLKHVKFSPGFKLLTIGVGAGVGALVGMTKANDLENSINKLVDLFNTVLG